MELVGIADVPCARGAAVIVGYGLIDSGVLRLFCIKRIPIFILRRPDLSWSARRVDLEDGVLLSVDLGIEAETEQVLVVVCIDARVDFCTPSMGVFAGCHRIRI